MSWKNLRSQKGFTLIELMIVVAIIGILAAVAIPKFADLVTKSKEASVKGTLGSVRSAVSIYYSESEGEFPSNLHTGLCHNNKYLPPLGGIESLGRMDLPKVMAKGNPGHDRGSMVIGQVLQDSLMLINDGTALSYATDGTAVGGMLINCTHQDTKNSLWTSY